MKNQRASHGGKPVSCESGLKNGVRGMGLVRCRVHDGGALDYSAGMRPREGMGAGQGEAVENHLRDLSLAKREQEPGREATDKPSGPRPEARARGEGARPDA